MRPTLTLLLISSSVWAIVHHLALEFYIYWQYPYFDVLMHILGGIIIVLFLFSLCQMFASIPSWVTQFFPALATVILIGLLWEVFELAVGLYPQQNFAFDTTLDLLADLVGGAVGYIVASNLRALEP